MKILLVLLLAGFGLAAATSFLPQSLKDDVQLYDDHEDFYEVLDAEDNEETKSLRKRLEELMQKLIQHPENDEHARRETVLEMKKIFDDMEKKNIELTNVEKMLKYSVNYYLKTLGSNLYFQDLLVHEDPKTELGRILKKHFEEILEKVRDIIENGKAYKEDLGEKLKQIAQKLKDMHVDIGDHAKDLLKKLKEKAKDFWKNILDKITPGSDNNALFAADSEEAKSLRKRLEKLMEIVKQNRDNDKPAPRETLLEMKKIFEDMEKKNIELTLVEQLVKWEVNFYLKRPDSPLYSHDLVANEGDDFAKNLRERFEEILEKIKDAIENRKVLGGNVVAKLKEIYQQMKEKSIPFGDKAKELLEEMKAKATGIWKRILDRINITKRFVEARGTSAENLRERLQELLEKLEESFRTRIPPDNGFLARLKKVRNEMRQKNVSLGGKLREMIEKLKKSINGNWRRILDRLLQKSPTRSEECTK